MISRLLANKRLIKRLLFFFARWNLYRPAAYLLYRCTDILKKGSPSKGSVKRVLITNWGKDGVLEDVEHIFRHDNTFEIIAWPNFALPVLASALLEPGLSHNRYVTTNPAVEATKVKYQNFLANVWRRYIAVSPVSAVLSINFGYYQQREFATAVERQGTPFIVLQKENFNGITPQRADFWRTVYREGRGEFTGRKILVYNEFERELEVSSGIMKREGIVVTGMPRLDRLHHWRHEQAGQPGTDLERPQVLFFTFAPKDKIPVIVSEKRNSHLPRINGTAQALERLESEWERRDWDQLCAGTHEAILEFARTRPDVQVIVKSKALAYQKTTADKLLGDDGKTLSNLKIINGGDSFKLLTESSVVVGFNTTALLEALAVGKSVIVPRFGEARKKEMQDIILDLDSAVEYADSPKELIDLISKNLARRTKVPLTLSAKSSKALKRYMGNDDGLAGKRVLDAIDAEIQNG